MECSAFRARLIQGAVGLTPKILGGLVAEDWASMSKADIAQNVAQNVTHRQRCPKSDPKRGPKRFPKSFPTRGPKRGNEQKAGSPRNKKYVVDLTTKTQGRLKGYAHH